MAKSTKTIPAAVQENQNKSQEPKGLEGFELESLRVSQDFVKDSGVKKLLTTVPVRKPNRRRARLAAEVGEAQRGSPLRGGAGGPSETA